MTTGEKIKMRRTALGLTLEQVGNVVGVHKSTVKRWEDGYTQSLDMKRLIPLCNVLLVKPEYFLNRDEDEITIAHDALTLATADLTPEEISNVLDYVSFLKAKRRKNK